MTTVQRPLSPKALEDGWARKGILNVAGSGKFSSDRTIAEDAADIWKVTPCPVGLRVTRAWKGKGPWDACFAVCPEWPEERPQGGASAPRAALSAWRLPSVPRLAPFRSLRKSILILALRGVASEAPEPAQLLL